MRISNRLVLTLSIFAAAGLGGACGGGSGSSIGRPSVDDSALSSGEVIYNADGLLETTVTVTLVDSRGTPVSGILVTLSSSRTNADTILEDQGATSDASGEAVFHVTSDTFGDSEFTAELPGLELTLTDTGTVHFTLSRSISFGRLRLMHPEATVDATVTVADARAGLDSAEISLASDRGADSFDPPNATTSSSGEAYFTVSTQLDGTANLSLQVATLNGSLDLGPFDFQGPTISGQVTFDQLYGVLTDPRVGVVYLDMENWDNGFGTPYELVSDALSISFGETQPYQLTLPIAVPSAHLFRPNDPNLPADFRMAPYAVVVYDDIGNTAGMMDASDLLVGVTDDLPSVLFASGTIPQAMTGLQPGYNMIDLFYDPPVVVNWADWADIMDVNITMADVPTATISGQLRFGNVMAPGTPITVSAVMFDPATFPIDPWDPANNAIVVSTSASYATNDATPYTLPLPDLTQHQHFNDWSVSFFGPAVNLMMLVAYWDINMNGRLEPASEPAYPPDQPWGVEGPMLWYVHQGGDWIFNFMWRFVHPGYMLVLFPLEYEIVGVDVNNGILYLDDDIEPNHTWISFKVIREDAQGDEITVVEANDLDTGVVLDNAATTSADLSSVQLQPPYTYNLVITEEIEDMEVLPFDQPVYFQLP